MTGSWVGAGGLDGPRFLSKGASSPCLADPTRLWRERPHQLDVQSLPSPRGTRVSGDHSPLQPGGTISPAPCLAQKWTSRWLGPKEQGKGLAHHQQSQSRAGGPGEHRGSCSWDSGSLRAAECECGELLLPRVGVYTGWEPGPFLPGRCRELAALVCSKFAQRK